MPKISMDRVNIRQNKALYEGALNRHGQYVRFYRSEVCYCMDDMGRADPACKVCLGRGYIYSPVTSIERTDSGMGNGGKYIDVKGKIKSIIRVYGSDNQDIEYSTFNNSTIELVENLKSGKYYNVDYIEDLEVSYSGIATYKGKGIISIPIIGYETLEGDFLGEIEEIISMTNVTRSEEINIISFWEDLVLTDSYAEESDEINTVCKYVKPLKLLISGISPKQRYENSFAIEEADLQLTFPGSWFIGAGDIITLLKAEQKASMVGRGSSDYKLPFFHTKSILSIRDEYGLIEDAIIVRNNEIKWGERIPDKFSINITYNPTFSVIDSLPSLRNAENKVFPKKVFLKRWDMFSRGNRRPSSTGINQEGMI